MKKIVMIGISKKILVLIILMASNFVNAQIDRSMPEPGPAPEISFKEPYTIKLDNNLTVMVVVNDKLPLASATLIIDNPPILEGELSGVKNLLSSNMGKGNKFQSKDEFIEEKDFMGSFINYSSNGGSFSSLAIVSFLSLVCWACLIAAVMLLSVTRRANRASALVYPAATTSSRASSGTSTLLS